MVDLTSAEVDKVSIVLIGKPELLVIHIGKVSIFFTLEGFFDFFETSLFHNPSW